MAGEKVQNLARCVHFGLHIDKEIGAIKAGHKGRITGKSQRRANIRLDTRGRGCRQRQTDRFGKALAYTDQLAVFRAKIMAPLGDTVRLINGNRRQPRGSQ